MVNIGFILVLWVKISYVGQSVKWLCQKAGIQDHYTNHFLRATATTCLFDSEVDDQLNMQQTGHSTTSAIYSFGENF